MNSDQRSESHRLSSATRLLLAAAATAMVLGVGMLVLQRWVAATFVAAVILVIAWFVVVAVAALVVGRLHPDLRRPMLATIIAVLIGTIAVGYWTGFRKNEVNENVAVASMRVPDRDRASALGPGDGTEPQAEKEDSGPVEIAAGRLSGADGHAATGAVTVIGDPGGGRVLTLTDLDADPGPDVNVYLSASTDGIDDAIDLGSLRGSVGNQQYEIPADADLNRYSNVVLYCIPFTTRIATAELG